jgi:hypothetical protein
LRSQYPALHKIISFYGDQNIRVTPQLMADDSLLPNSSASAVAALRSDSAFKAQLHYELNTLATEGSPAGAGKRLWRVSEEALRQFFLGSGIVSISDPYVCLSELYRRTLPQTHEDQQLPRATSLGERIELAQRAAKVFFSDVTDSTLTSDRLKIATGQVKADGK